MERDLQSSVESQFNSIRRMRTASSMPGWHLGWVVYEAVRINPEILLFGISRTWLAPMLIFP
jgi:hypothetical protein